MPIRKVRKSHPPVQTPAKAQRIRDPIHDIIGFSADTFEATCWSVAQSRPFQRLRRVKQLGFSEMVYPGATHSRFAHSVGVFHTARRISERVRSIDHDRYGPTRAQVAQAAALVHDLGHGPFSHAFEDAMARVEGKKRHEIRTGEIICETEIKDALDKLRPGFANEVAALITSKNPIDIYSAIVSSQFDADRLDYMRRDRLMTGTQGSAIDFTWLVENLQVGRVSIGTDEVKSDEVETLVVGRKAIPAAEAYVLGLFQLYSTVYLHKTTRGAEKLFSELIARVAESARDGMTGGTGLPRSHPLIRYVRDPSNLSNFLELDDFVVAAAISAMCESKDKLIKDCANRLVNRKLLRCLDVTDEVDSRIPAPGATESKQKKLSESEAWKARDLRIRKIVSKIQTKLSALKKPKDENGLPLFLEDKCERNPYERSGDNSDTLKKIWVHDSGGNPYDLAQISSVVGGLRSFFRYRVYAQDQETIDQIRKIVTGELE